MGKYNDLTNPRLPTYRRSVSLNYYRCLNTFSSLGKDYALRRRRITEVYAKSFIQRSQHVEKIIDTLIFERYLPQIMRSTRTGTPLDVLSLNTAYGVDFVSAFIFGLPRGTNFMGDTWARNIWMAGYLKSHSNQYMFWLLEAQNLRMWLTKFGIHIVPRWVWEARNNLEQWALQLVDATEADLSMVAANKMQDGDYPVVYHRLKVTKEVEQQKGEVGVSSAGECLDHLGISLHSSIAVMELTPGNSSDPRCV